MKTRELIRQLQEADPSGELECCVNNHDIHFVSRQPANYDGCVEILVHDPNQKSFDVVGGIMQCYGEKVRLHTLSLEECLFEFELQFPIEIRSKDESNRKIAENQLEEWKQSAKRELEEVGPNTRNRHGS